MALFRKSRALFGGMVSAVSLSLLLSLTLIAPLRATQRMVLAEEFTNTG